MDRRCLKRWPQRQENQQSPSQSSRRPFPRRRLLPQPTRLGTTELFVSWSFFKRLPLERRQLEGDEAMRYGQLSGHWSRVGSERPSHCSRMRYRRGSSLGYRQNEESPVIPGPLQPSWSNRLELNSSKHWLQRQDHPQQRCQSLQPIYLQVRRAQARSLWP